MENSSKINSKKEQEKTINISLKSGSETEQAAKKMLEGVLFKYTLDRWIRCREVLIEDGVRPHSHPIVTISGRKNESAMLALFLHEQIHWIETGKEKQMDAAIDELKILFPDAPVGGPVGADNEKSTYRHLIVCRLEFLALQELCGEEKAKTILLGNPWYTWIRHTAVDAGDDIDIIIGKYFPEEL